MAQDVTIKSVSVNDDGQKLHVSIVVHNPANRTRYVYSSARALRYDRATRVLQVQMSDEGLIELRDLRGPPSGATFTLPDIVVVEPNADAEVSVRLERTITRVDPARSTDVLRLETLPIHEATTVKVDLAWSNTPFYLDPRTPYGMREQLTKWAKGVASHQIKRTPRPPKRDQEDEPDRKKRNRDKDRDKD